MLLDGTEPEKKCPKVLGARSLTLALALHLALFLFAFLFATITRKPKETTIPIDLTVVVEENLDGNEDEPPPLKPPTPEQPQPTPPKPEPKPEPPKIKDDPKIDAVEKVVEKPKPKEKKKSAAEIKKEKEDKKKKRMAEMVKKSKLVKGDKKPVERQPNGKTGKKTLSAAEIQKLLGQGYKPGRTEQLATDEYQRCISLISAAFYDKWNRPPWTDTLREMHLSVQLGSGGRILRYKLIQGSGDPRADATVLQAASLVHSVRGLSNEFISQNKTVTVRFKVTPQ